MMKITRWGHSIGLRLPCEVAQAAGLTAGDYVYVRLLDSGDIRVRPVKNAQPALSSNAEGESSTTAITPSAPAKETQW